MADDRVEALIEELQLQPHPEGGFYRETFRSPVKVTRVAEASEVGGEARAAGTAIYFLLPGGEFSAWHVVRSDEAWHHYDGAPLELHLIDPAGGYRLVRLGRDFAHGERPQFVVPAGWLQAARPMVTTGAAAARHTLCGCTVCPGFDFADFAMPMRDELRRRYPALVAIIDELTRG
jgi:predicted cupin superfamily sugar epimerase